MFDKHKGNKPRTATEAPRESSRDNPSFSPAPAAATGKVAVIGPGIDIDGAITGSENLLVEGRVKGSIELPSFEVTVGKSGRVAADITGRVIKIAGEVNGDLSGEERVVISGTGNVHGNVKAPRVVLEDGAIFKGSIDMDPGETIAPVKAVESVESAESRSAPKASAPAAAAEGGKAPDLALKSR